jgi:integrase
MAMPCLLDEIGAPMAVRQDRLGHAEAQTTMGAYPVDSHT